MMGSSAIKPIRWYSTILSIVNVIVIVACIENGEQQSGVVQDNSNLRLHTCKADSTFVKESHGQDVFWCAGGMSQLFVSYRLPKKSDDTWLQLVDLKMREAKKKMLDGIWFGTVLCQLSPADLVPSIRKKAINSPSTTMGNCRPVNEEIVKGVKGVKGVKTMKAWLRIDKAVRKRYNPTIGMKIFSGRVYFPFESEVNLFYKFARRDDENDDEQIAFVISDRNKFLYDFSSLNNEDCQCTADMIDTAFHSAVRCPRLRKFLPMLANIKTSREKYLSSEEYEAAKKADEAAMKKDEAEGGGAA